MRLGIGMGMGMGMGMERLPQNQLNRWWWGLGLRLSSPNSVVAVALPPQLRRCRMQCNRGNRGGDQALRTCRNCKSQFDRALNHPSACAFHPGHFGGETKRKFESVYTGGTMNTPDSGQVFQYWHCCGSPDPFHPGCSSAPHASYDD